MIVYVHPLLGVGLSKLLSAEPGLTIETFTTGQMDAVHEALSASPDVVIVERSAGAQAVDLLPFAPEALLIDVGLDAGPTSSYQRAEVPNRPEGILRAIRRLRRTAGTSLVGSLALVAAIFGIANAGRGA